MFEPTIIREKVREPQVRSEDFWFRLITSIDFRSMKPERKGRLFGPRDKNFPI